MSGVSQSPRQSGEMRSLFCRCEWTIHSCWDCLTPFVIWICEQWSLAEVANVLIAKLEASIVSRNATTQGREWVATFGVLLEKLREEELPVNAPADLPMLYDWLTEDLMARLSRTSMSHVRMLDDLRDGEQLSIRLGFEWDLSKEALNFGDMGWWELLEFASARGDLRTQR